MFHNRKRYSILFRIISVILIQAFFLSNLALASPDFSLARWTANDDYLVRREALAKLYRDSRLIRLATSPRYLDLLTRHNALALLLPSGRYLMTPEIAANDLSLIRAAAHEDFEVLMQREERLHSTRYERLKKQLLDNEEIMAPYRNLSGYKDITAEPDNIIFNDLIAKAFELLFIIDEYLVYPNTELSAEERQFIELMRPILEAKDSRGRYKNFSQIFFDIEKRTKLVRGLQDDKDERFYRVASAESAKRKTSGPKVTKLKLPSWIPEAAQKKQAFYFGKEGAEGYPRYTDLLGNKGTNLATMANMKMPIPPGFTLTTLVTLNYLEKGKLPQNFKNALRRWVARVEKEMGKKFGSSTNPLLLSVRSGAKFSMPGFLKTVTNVGLNDETVEALARQIKDRRFAYDTYARFLADYGTEVLGIKDKEFESITESLIKKKKAKDRENLDATALEELVALFKARIEKLSKQPVPQDPYEQLIECIKAVMMSWNTREAAAYRARNNIPDNIGTAVNIQAMVFGNIGSKSATGVAFSRNPLNGEREIFGEVLFNAQGKDIVSGKVTPQNISELKKKMPEVYKKLNEYLEALEEQFSEIQEVEFTIENGELYILQTRGNLQKVTPLAKMCMLIEMHKNWCISDDELDDKTTLEELQWLRKALDSPLLNPKSKKRILAIGIPASPGLASGKVVFNRNEAIRRAKRGESIIWVVGDFIEFTTKDEEAVKLVEGVLMQRGGATSHPAVVCRGLGQLKPVVTGIEDSNIDIKKGVVRIGGTTIKKDAYITLDGIKGRVIQGKLTKADLVKDIKYWGVSEDLLKELGEMIARKKLEREADETIETVKEESAQVAKLPKVPEYTKEKAIEILAKARKIMEEKPENWRREFGYVDMGPNILLLGELPTFPGYDEKILIIRYLYIIDKELLGRIMTCAGISHIRLKRTFEKLREPKDFDLLVDLIEQMAFFDITELSPEEKSDFDKYDKYTLVRLLMDFPKPLLQKVLSRMSKKALHNIVEQFASIYTLSSIQQVLFGIDDSRGTAEVEIKALTVAVQNAIKSLSEKERETFTKALSKTAKAWVEGKIWRDIFGTLHIGTSATLLRYMFGYRNGIPGQAEPISRNNAAMPQDMAKQRGVSDSLSNIYRELIPLERAGIVEGGKGLSRYLADWVLGLDPEEIIIQNPELNQPSLYKDEVAIKAVEARVGEMLTGFELGTEEERKQIRARNQEYLKSKGWWDEIKSIRYSPRYIEEEPNLPAIMDTIAQEIKRNESLIRNVVVPMIVHPDDIPKVTDEEVNRTIRNHIKSFAYLLQSVFLYSRGKQKKALEAYQKALKQAEKEFPKLIQEKEETMQKILESIRAIENQQLRQDAEKAWLETIPMLRNQMEQGPAKRIGLLGFFNTGLISDDLFSLAEDIYMKPDYIPKARYLFKLGLELYDVEKKSYHIPQDFALNLAFLDLDIKGTRGTELLQSVLGITHGLFNRWAKIQASLRTQLGKGLGAHYKQTKDKTMEASSYVKKHGTAIVLGAGSFVVFPLVEMLRERLPDGTLKYKKIILVELGEGISEQALDDLIHKGTITENEAGRVEIVRSDASLILKGITSRIDEIMLAAAKKKSRKFPRKEIAELFKEIADPKQLVKYALPAKKRLFAGESINFAVFAMAIQDFALSIKDYIDIWSKYLTVSYEDTEPLRQWQEVYANQVQKNIAGLVIKDLSRILSPQGIIFLADSVGLQIEPYLDRKGERKDFYGTEGIRELVPRNLPLQIVNHSSWLRPLNLEEQERSEKANFIIESLVLRKKMSSSISPLVDTEFVQQVFSTLGKETRRISQLNSEISRLRGTSQDLMEATKFRFCVPVDVLRNSPDITHALDSTGLLKQKSRQSENIEFELVVTGVTDEDVSLIEGLNREDIRKALNLPERFTVSMITERQMQETAGRFSYDISNPKHRVAIVKDFFSGTLTSGEHMAIATDAVKEEDAEDLKSEIEKDLQSELAEENISIRVVVRPKAGRSMYSLSKIINDWLEDINQGNPSSIAKILPIPTPLTPELERAIKEAWAVLTAA